MGVRTLPCKSPQTNRGRRGEAACTLCCAVRSLGFHDGRTMSIRFAHDAVSSSEWILPSGETFCESNDCRSFPALFKSLYEKCGYRGLSTKPPSRGERTCKRALDQTARGSANAPDVAGTMCTPGGSCILPDPRIHWAHTYWASASVRSYGRGRHVSGGIAACRRAGCSGAVRPGVGDEREQLPQGCTRIPGREQCLTHQEGMGSSGIQPGHL